VDASNFPYVKRDLVKLLGILCHDRKAIQDRIRLCGGIPIVLNLCTIDDRNPCKCLFGLCWFACCFCSGVADLTLSHSTVSLHLRFGWADCENPDLREYAIIALRNLLHNSPENQAVVNTFQADKHVGPDVVVRDLGAK
jgi:spinocerebellar ataxia type 10 like protein